MSLEKAIKIWYNHRYSQQGHLGGMSRLETQINQIFLLPKDSNKVSLILFEEKLSSSVNLFLIAELRNVLKKTEANDLGKISEIIIESFKANKKLSGETIFEAALVDINNKLAEFAHKGRKSWLGKFSALIAVKSDRDFYLANTGHTSAWLKRKNSLNEIASPDKTETHPLKIFMNFSSGRLTDKDNLVLTTSSVFNYISVELFSKTLNSFDLEQACPKIADILKSSARSDEGFAVFMLALNKKIAAVEPEPQVMEAPPEPTPKTQPEPVVLAKQEKKLRSSLDSSGKKIKAEAGASGVLSSLNNASKALAPSQSAPGIEPHVPLSPIYAPLPEDLYEEKQNQPVWKTPSLPRLENLSVIPTKLTSSFKQFKNWKKIISFSNWRWPNIGFLPNVSGPAKFFLISFILFIILFGLNIVAYGVRKSKTQVDERFKATAEALVNYLADAESSLLYKNFSQATKLMASAETELHKLEQLGPEKIAPFQAKFEEMDNKINRVTIIKNLSSVYEAPYPITFLSKAGLGFLASNNTQNSLSMFQDNTLNKIFMINSIDGSIRGIAHVSGIGNYVETKDKIYLANSQAQEFQQKTYISNADLIGLKFANPNRLYAINKSTNQVVRLTVSGTAISTPTDLLKTSANLQTAQDFGVDNDIFVLYPDRVEKFSPTGQSQNFQLTPLSDPVGQMSKIRVGNQLYILEPVANRILIFSRTGELQNQIKFPELNDMKDLFIDEGARELMIVNGNKIYRITF